MILIAASFSLLVIVAGMFLLAKTQKENLSRLFKYVSYFVIIVGFLNFFGGGACMLMRMCMKHCAENCETKHCKKSKRDKHCKMERCEQMKCEMGGMDDEKCSMMNGKKCHMENGKCVMDGGKCCMEMEEECAEEGMGKSCCKEKMIIKKDSVIIKK
jgi:hypothetical protein